MDTSKLKPFNLERALAGDRVVTRRGQEVKQLTLFDIQSDYRLYGVLDGLVRGWTINGIFSDRNVDDLFMTPTKKEGWINIYPCQEFNKGVAYSSRDIYDIYETKELAEMNSSMSCVATIRIEWEE